MMRRIWYLLLSLVLALAAFPMTTYAKPDWPTDTGILSEAGIVMDMDSGAIIFTQDIHKQKVPASITKLLTALVVIENSRDLDEPVKFSHDAVYNVESGSGNKLALEEGDVLSVRECLYVMLLQSSNQAANALAEHVGGTREKFVDMMNQKVAELGCQESTFANPSGLNDDKQRTSAYDMALIARACFQNPTLLEISSTKKSSIPATINNPEGRNFSMEHKLLITEDASSENYYPYAVAGKTGYTSQAGQTLVTYAKKGDRGQIAVTLKSTDKTHYSDTKTILDFGFARFKNVNVADNEIEYVTGSDPVKIGDQSYEPSELYVDKSAVITIPNEAQFSDAEKKFVTDLGEKHPDEAVGKFVYEYNERKIGEAWLCTTRQQSVSVATPVPSEEGEQPGDENKDLAGQPGGKSAAFPNMLLIGGACALGAALIIGAGGIVFYMRRKAEKERMRLLREKRRQRLADIGYSEEDFERVMEERRQRRT